MSQPFDADSACHRDEEIVGVGFHWDSSDELKLLDSFDKGREDLFSHFVDVRIQVRPAFSSM